MQRDVYSDDDDMEVDASLLEREELIRFVAVSSLYPRCSSLRGVGSQPSTHSARIAQKEDQEALEAERRHEEEKRRRRREKERHA